MGVSLIFRENTLNLVTDRHYVSSLDCRQWDIFLMLVPLFQTHIKNPDWRYREASLMAFGAILEGPEPSNLKPLVEEAMPMLIELMKDESVAVKDTAAWTIGRVCELVRH